RQRRAGLRQDPPRRLDRNRHARHADVVVGRPDGVATAAAVARLDHLLDDALDDLLVGSRVDQRDALDADGRIAAEGLHVGVRQPDDRVDALRRYPAADGASYRSRLHGTRPPEDDDIGPESTHFRPGGGLFGTGHRIRELLEREALVLDQCVQQGNRFLSEWGIDVHEGDLLALQSASVLVDVLHQQGGLRTVDGRAREHIRERLAVDRVGTTVGEGDHRHLVRVGSRHHRVGYRGAQEVEEDVAVTQGLVVERDALLRVARMILDGQADGVAVDAAFGVHEPDVVLLALAVFGRHEGIDAGEVHQRGELDWVLALGKRSPAGQAERNGCGGDQATAKQGAAYWFHRGSPLVYSEFQSPVSSGYAGTARRESTCAGCRRSWPARAVRRAGSR